MHELQRKQASRKRKEVAAARDRQTLLVLQRSVEFLAKTGKLGMWKGSVRTVSTIVFICAAVRHEKARAIFLDPGEARPGELMALKGALEAGGLDGQFPATRVTQEM